MVEPCVVCRERPQSDPDSRMCERCLWGPPPAVDGCKRCGCRDFSLETDECQRCGAIEYGPRRYIEPLYRIVWANGHTGRAREWPWMLKQEPRVVGQRHG